MENREQELNHFFEPEFEKIPRPFRLSKKLPKIAIGILLGLAGIDAILLAILPQTQKLNKLDYAHTPVQSYDPLPIASYSTPIIIAVIVISILIVLVALWLIICTYFEKKAFKKASKTYREYIEYERKMLEKERKELKKDLYF